MMAFGRSSMLVLVLTAVLLVPGAARADIIGFLGTNTTPSGQAVKGAALTLNIMVVSVEFEFASAGEDAAKGLPGQNTVTASAQFVTPTGRVQAYGGIGVGLARETFGASSAVRTVGSFGGGIKIGLAGPLGVRIDYRIVTLNQTYGVDTGSHHRIYVGANVHF